MGWFSKRREDVPDGPAEAASAPVSEQDSNEFALDTLASVIRNYGKLGFDIGAMSRSDLEKRCDAWARHVSNGAPAPIGSDDDEPVDEADKPEDNKPMVTLTLEQRSWPDLQQFFAGHRRDEQRAVLSAGDNMRSLISEMTRCLREAVTDDNAKDREVAHELAEMNTHSPACQTTPPQ